MHSTTHVHTCSLHISNSHEPIGYNTKVCTDKVEWGRVNLRTVYMVYLAVALIWWIGKSRKYCQIKFRL